MGSAVSVAPVLYRSETIRLALAAGMIFMLAAANSIPRWWNSAYPALMLSAALVALHVFSERYPFRVPRRHRVTTFFLIFWVVAAFASWFAHPTWDSTLTTFYAYFIPACIYVALSLRDISKRDAGIALAALAVGALIPSVSGILAYFRSWGIPSLAEAALHRYDLIGMAPYQLATFGNIGHMAGYACLVAPTVLAAALTKAIAGYARSLCVACYAVLALNVLVVQSRAGFLVFMAMSVMVLLAFRRHGIVVLAIIGLFASVSQVLEDLTFLQQHLAAAVTVDVEGDASIAMRLESISHSWSMFMRDPLFGVGPGLSRSDNPFSVAHQFFVHQAAELGVLGLIATVGITIVVVSRFLIAAITFRNSGGRSNETIWLSGATGWLLYICIAGATLNMTTAIPWIGLFVAFLALSSSSDNVVPTGR